MSAPKILSNVLYRHTLPSGIYNTKNLAAVTLIQKPVQPHTYIFKIVEVEPSATKNRI